MSDFKYEFRVLMEDTNGTTYAYGSSSLVSMAANTSKVVTTEQMLESINLMPSMSFYNAPSFTTSSTALFNDNYDSNPDSKVLKISSLLYYQSQSFGPSSRGGGFGTQNPTIHTDYQFLSCSIKDHALSGSIIFHTNTTPHPTQGTTLKRYKFWGSKVCQVLGVPENYWIYSDKFRLSNTGSEQNYLSGDVLATSLNLKTNFAINNAGSITSDLPFRHFKESDRYVRWTDISSSIPVNRMLVGYNQHRDEYGIEMPSDDSLILSASSVSASGDFEINGKLTIGGDMVNTNGNPVVFSNETGSFLTNISYGSGQGVIEKTTPGGGASPTSIGAITNLGTSGTPTFASITTTAATTAINMPDGGRIGDMAGPNNDDYIKFDQTNRKIQTFIDNNKVLSVGMDAVGINTENTPKPLTVNGDISGSGNLFIGNQTTGGSLYVNGGQADSSDNRFRFHHNLTDGFIDIRDHSTRAGNINFRGLTGDVDYYTAMTINADSGHITASGGISAGGSIFGRLPMAYHCGAQWGTSSDIKFLAFWGHAEGAPNTGEDGRYSEHGDTDEGVTRIIAPFAGYVHSVILRCNSAAGNACSMQLYKAADGTSADDTDANVFGDPVVKDQNTAATPVRYDFGSTYTFNAGDVLAIKWDPVGDANDTEGQLILMCDVTYNG